MATSRALTPDIQRMLDSQSADIAKALMKGIADGMGKEGAQLFKKMFGKGKGDQGVIGDTTDPKKKEKDEKKRADKLLREHMRLAKRGEDYRGKIYLWFLKKTWGPKFLNLWSKFWYGKMFVAVRNTFERVTGFFKQQFTDIFGEFMPIIDLIKDSLIHVKDIAVGVGKLGWGVIKVLNDFRKKYFSKEGFLKFVGAMKNGWSSLAKRFDRLAGILKGKSSVARTITLSPTEKRKRGRPKKGAVAEEASIGFLSMVMGSIAGGTLGKILGWGLKAALGVLLAGGIWKLVAGWLGNNPDAERDLKSITGAVADMIIAAGKGIWTGIKWIVGDLLPTLYNKIGEAFGPGGQFAAVIAAMGLAVLKIGQWYKALKAILPAGAMGASGGAGGDKGAGGAGGTGPGGVITPGPGGKNAPSTAGGPVKKPSILSRGARSLGGKLPLIGGVIAGAIDYMAHGDATRATGTAVGTALGTGMGAVLGGPIGAFIGGSIGSVVGDMIGEKISGLMGSGEAHAGMMPGGMSGGAIPSAKGLTSNDFKDMPASGWDKSTKGNPAQRLNNPGNIKASTPFGKKLIAAGMAKDSGQGALDGGTFLEFKTPEDGWNAMGLALTNNWGRSLTNEALPKWSGGGYGISDVAPEFSGKKIGDLSKEELKTLMSKMAQREGFFAKGKGPSVPAGKGGMGGGMGGGLLSTLLGSWANDPLFKMFFGDEMDAFEKELGLGSAGGGIPLTAEEMLQKTNETGQSSANLQQQEAELSKRQYELESANQSLPSQVVTPVPAGGGGQMSSSNITGSTGTPDPPSSILGGGIPTYLLINGYTG